MTGQDNLFIAGWCFTPGIPAGMICAKDPESIFEFQCCPNYQTAGISFVKNIFPLFDLPINAYLFHALFIRFNKFQHLHVIGD